MDKLEILSWFKKHSCFDLNGDFWMSYDSEFKRVPESINKILKENHQLEKGYYGESSEV